MRTLVFCFVPALFACPAIYSILLLQNGKSSAAWGLSSEVGSGIALLVIPISLVTGKGRKPKDKHAEPED